MRHAVPSFPPLRLLLLVTAMAAPGCRDSTAPTAAGPSRAPAAHAAASIAAPPQVVSPENMRGWSFVQGSSDLPCAPDRCTLVDGPAAPPLGTGSASVRAAAGSAAALVLGEHAGTPLSRLTALRYAAFSDPATGTAPAALELRVEFDADDPARGDLGSLVHEPVAGGEGAAGWTTYDALDGLWWSDRHAGRAAAGADSLPCVRARPCRWDTMLARYPGIALAGGAGAVRLAARRGRAGTAHVDAMTLAVDGVPATWDFEARAPRPRYALTTSLGDGVVAEQLPADSAVPAGTALAYAFSSRPGRAEPLVILDDTTLLAAAGQVVMDTTHTLRVVSDTVYSYATLTPLERRFADLTRELLTSHDKVAVAQAMNDLAIAELHGGTDPEVLGRAARLADYLMVDPERDSAEIRQVDQALAGRDFHYEAGFGMPYAWSSPGRSALVAPAASPAAGLGAAMGDALAGQGAAIAATLQPAARTAALGTLDDPARPREGTRVVYTNGVWTARAAAFATATRLATLGYALPRFRGAYTTFIMHYNPTHSEQMKDYDRRHPCVLRFMRASDYVMLTQRIGAWARCKGVSFGHAVTSIDIVEAVTARVQFELRLPPTTESVALLARAAAAWRRNDYHVLLVGHSEGTILQAAAVQQLPAMEQHPLNVANRCVAVLALAPATERVSYGMDEHYLMGLRARHDIIRFTASTGWEEIDSPLSRALSDSLRFSRTDPMLLAADYGVRIHGIDETYLGSEVAPMVLDRLTRLHRECVAGSVDLHLSPSEVPLGTSMTASIDVRNQHGRPLPGRRVSLNGLGYYFDRLDGLTFRAMAPRDGPIRASARAAPGLESVTYATVPLVRPSFAIRETLLWEWVEVAAGNGPGATGGPVPTPTGSWDGSASTCYRRETYEGSAGNWKTYELRCNRAYTPLYTTPDTLVTGRRVRSSTVWFTTPAGVTSIAPHTYLYCEGATPCVASGYLEWRGDVGVVGRSAVVAPVVAGATTASRAAAPGSSTTTAPRRLVPARPRSPDSAAAVRPRGPRTFRPPTPDLPR